MKQFVFILLAFLAVTIGLLLYIHNAVFILDGPDNGFLLTKTESVRYSVYLPAFYVHIVTGSLVLIAGVFQLSKKLRSRFPKYHKLSGRVYALVLLALTAPAGFVMSLFANGGFAAATGFGILATLWWIFTWTGFRAAINGDMDRHREFMLRSYVLTFSAVTLRLYSFLFALAGFKGELTYVIIAWLSWAPSLIVVELYLRRTQRSIPVKAQKAWQ